MDTSKDAILAQLKTLLHDLFELEPNAISLDSKLYEDLDLDSIDAVDLIVHLQTLTNKKFNPEEFKSVRTVSDVVNVIHSEIS